MSAADIQNLVIGALQGVVSSTLFVLILFIGFCVLIGFTKTKKTAGGNARVRVITSSQLQPDMLKTNDIVYIGYLSALGILRDQVFATSRFKVGDSFDEVIDSETGKTYVSSAGEALSDESNRDYGYLAAVRGPTGNRIIAIAGTRDIGVMETAQIASDKQALAALQVRRNNDLAALYEVQGMGRTNFTYRLVSDRKGP